MSVVNSNVLPLDYQFYREILATMVSGKDKAYGSRLATDISH